MKALVISGGGSKGAFAGGVAQYLIEEQKNNYDMFLGTSTGSLLISQLANNKINRAYEMYTQVNQHTIFDVNPFNIKQKGNREYVSINYFNTIWQFIRRKRTFGESRNLLKNIKKNFSREEFEYVKRSPKNVIVTVSNLTKNSVEYKSMDDCSYEDFCEWVWISCNYVPFMSLVKKNGNEYADGGFGCIVPIREAIRRGATEVDAIILESENMEHNKILGKNPFSLMVNLFSFLMDQVEYHDVVVGKLAAINKEVPLNLYYTPSKLTENSLIFNKKLMTNWWQQGWDYAAEKAKLAQDNKLKDLEAG
ncbi:patatin family protein [Leeuwenhoekiella sp. A16]|uniref:patatin-like phospholipase family protein n=1 Tax=unclassified Leeuwenhoekiella TaxID=2615029 RepID=UPI003A80EA68|tara:strand:- start:509 stop:1429 length:921 start_codon:yes stop_codon:yes gene_type:complete